MRAEELYGEGGYRCEFPFDSVLLPVNGLLTLFVQFQTSEVVTTSPPRGRLSRLPFLTMAPLVVEGGGPHSCDGFYASHERCVT